MPVAEPSLMKWINEKLERFCTRLERWLLHPRFYGLVVTLYLLSLFNLVDSILRTNLLGGWSIAVHHAGFALFILTFLVLQEMNVHGDGRLCIMSFNNVYPAFESREDRNRRSHKVVQAMKRYVSRPVKLAAWSTGILAVIHTLQSGNGTWGASCGVTAIFSSVALYVFSAVRKVRLTSPFR